MGLNLAEGVLEDSIVRTWAYMNAIGRNTCLIRAACHPHKDSQAIIDRHMGSQPIKMGKVFTIEDPASG